MASNALLVFIHRSNALHRREIEMGHADEGVLSAHYERQLADVRADLAFHKNRADRAEFARQALEHHNAVLSEKLKPLPKAEQNTRYYAVQWAFLDGQTVHVMAEVTSDFDGDEVDVYGVFTADGTEITPLFESLGKTRRYQLQDAVAEVAKAEAAELAEAA